MVKRLAVAATIFAFTLSAGTANAVSKCAGAKLKAVGKKASCKLGIEAKEAGKAEAADPLKLAGCETKFSAAIAKADSKGPDCTTGGDAGSLEAKIDAFVDDVDTEISGAADPPATASKCQGAKIKAAGKKVKCKLGLRAKVASKGDPLDPAKEAGCESKFSAAFAKAELGDDCGASTGDAGAIEAKIDAFVDDVVDELPSASPTTTTTLPGPACAPIVPSQAIAQTYVLNGTTGEQRCVTTSPTNRFGTCASDSNCDNDPPCNVGEVDCTGTCLPLPWVTADGQVMSFPTGVSTKFTVTNEDSYPTCEHDICIPCGNPNGVCAGIPGCAVAGNPNGCIPRATQGCCDAPGFNVPVFFVNLLGGLCSRVDQIGCGTGVVNTSNPQTGDNDVDKKGDTTNPGADCNYGTGDDPAPLACTVAQAGNDYNGKILRTQGNGSNDANGIQFRFVTPELSTTWTDNQSNAGECAAGSIYDDGEVLISQLLIKAEPTSAGASGSFTDLSGDGCARAGNGFISAANASTNGPITVPGAPAGPLRPQSYDGTVGPVTGAVSEVFSGPNSPIKDIGFVAITPNMPAAVAPAASCSCTLANGCPE